jgi:hypothetical protein
VEKEWSHLHLLEKTTFSSRILIQTCVLQIFTLFYTDVTYATLTASFYFRKSMTHINNILYVKYLSNIYLIVHIMNTRFEKPEYPIFTCIIFLFICSMYIKNSHHIQM